ncbi:hypothetical protein MNBD_GAMMA21-803 [hydrothermal vent metagenome]|uniref:Uncharacterized protein n=1 Tax=hydrothermal vent metagenome TaxID=652676 RepID=A0A3B1A2X3_9ZZZZ
MNSKTIFNYVIGAVAGIGLTIGSAAFAVNTVHGNGNHSGGMMGNATQQATPAGMHGNTNAKTYGGMMGNTTQQAIQNGMHGNTTQTIPDGMHNGMATGTDRQNAPCHVATDSKDKKS